MSNFAFLQTEWPDLHDPASKAESFASPSAWGSLAMCLLQGGQRDEARKAIDYAIDLDPQDPINRYIRDNFESYFK